MQASLRQAGLVGACVLIGSPAGGAATSSAPVSVTATVSQVETISCTPIECTSSGGTETCGSAGVSSMNFGTLERPTNADGTPGAQQGAKFFKVFCGMNTARRPYTVTQTGTALTSGGNSIPDNAWVFTPASCVDTDGVAGCDALPAGASVGSKASANGTRTWYNSGLGGNSATIQAAYSIPGNPADTASGGPPLVPPDQPAGDYTGNVTWTLTVQ